MNPHLLFEEQMALDDEHLVDNRNDNGVALFSDGRYRVDRPANPNPFDFRRLVSEQFIDQMLSLMCDPCHLDAGGLDDLLRNRGLFSNQRNNGFGGLRGSGGSVAIP
jgi:hypothetical protein